MLTFDAPIRDTCTVRRSTTNTPLQALTTLNETAFLEASRTMAQRLLKCPVQDRMRLRLAYDMALGRSPDARESEILLSALDRYRKIYRADPLAARKLVSVGDTPPPTSGTPEVAAWMIVCSSIMNTDEFLTLH